MSIKRRFLFIILALVGITVSINVFLPFFSLRDSREGQIIATIDCWKDVSHNEGKVPSSKYIPCDINGKESEGCLYDGQHAYVQFDSVKKYCEVEGSASSEKVLWKQSNISVHHLPFTNYTSDGPFMYFHQYDVEMRSRVLLISPREGVPISIQWDSRGYFYPIQIAQYALSHYSKFLLNKYDEIEDQSTNNYFLSRHVNDRRVSPSLQNESILIEAGAFDYSKNEAYNSPFIQYINQNEDGNIYNAVCLVARGEWLSQNAALSLTIEVNGSVTVELVYLCSDLSKEENAWIGGTPYRIIYKVCETDSNDSPRLMHLVRNIRVDYTKAVHILSGKMRGGRNNAATIFDLPQHWRVTAISIYGTVKVNEFRLRRHPCHKDHFLQAADWFLHHQDSQGGYSVPVARRLKGRIRLKPNWYSAMAQGHAMSVLVRAYHMTKNISYLTRASACQRLFYRDVKSGGIQTHLVNLSYVWYEEYPIQPSLYVLNGFIYSLIGLYDLTTIEASADRELYQNGMMTLRTFLPLFDSGFGSFYDLRHWSDPAEFSSGPNRARWEYHAVHIAQLHLLNLLDPNTRLWRQISDRWHSYMLGHRSPHN